MPGDPPIAFNDLTDDELQLVIGLMMVAINADYEYSPEEQSALKRIADEVGRERFVSLSQVLKTRYPDQKSILDAAADLQRQQVRELTYDLLEELAAADGVVDEEAHLLEWLKNKWEL